MAVAAQREMYWWVGEKQFGDRSLSDIVKEGSISSGYFQGLNGADFLLPSETHLHIKDLNGTESENWTVYSACHESNWVTVAQ